MSWWTTGTASAERKAQWSLHTRQRANPPDLKKIRVRR